MNGITLTLPERNTLAQHESVIERGLKTFQEVGAALLAIRDERLYREHYKTFEEYCQERWNFKRSYAYELMDAASTVANLSGIPDIPQNVAQVRPLTRLTFEQQREAWQEAVEVARGKPTAAQVAQVAQKYKAPKPNETVEEFLDRELPAPPKAETKPAMPPKPEILKRYQPEAPSAYEEKLLDELLPRPPEPPKARLFNSDVPSPSILDELLPDPGKADAKRKEEARRTGQRAMTDLAHRRGQLGRELVEAIAAEFGKQIEEIETIIGETIKELSQ